MTEMNGFHKGECMKLWLLRPVNGQECFEDYDTAQGFVVRAETEVDARKLAQEEAGDEGYRSGDKSWVDRAFSTCVELTADGPAGVILRDFNAG